MLPLLLACNLPFTAPPAPPPPPQLPGVMVGRLILTDGRFTVFNDSEHTWSSVVIHPDGGALCNVGLVHSKDQAGLNLANCSGTVGPVVTTATITADQGSLAVSFTPPVAVGVGGVTQPVTVDPSVAQGVPTPEVLATAPGGLPPAAAAAPVPGTPPSYAMAPASTAATAAPSAAAPSAAASPSRSTAGGTPATPTAVTPTAATSSTSNASTSNASTSSAKSRTSSGSRLTGNVAMSGGIGPARRVTVFNESDLTWTGCTVTLTGGFSYAMRDLAPGTSEGIMAFKFKNDRGTPFTTTAQVDTVEVACKEGGVSVVPR